LDTTPAAPRRTLVWASGSHPFRVEFGPIVAPNHIANAPASDRQDHGIVIVAHALAAPQRRVRAVGARPHIERDEIYRKEAS
jgi:hypothetical protein